MKKLLLLLLCLTMFLLAFSGCSSSGNKQSTTPQTTEEPYPEANPASDFEYELSHNCNEIHITKYIGEAEDVVIPTTIEGLPVTALKGSKDGSHKIGTFENCNVKTVIIPNSITLVDENTFLNCRELTSVSFPNKCKSILCRTFQNCEKLKEIDISDSSILSIGPCAFENCVSLTEIKLPDSLIKIECNAFYNCSSLLKIKFPKNLKEIETGAFYECTSLNEITINAKLNMMVMDFVRFYNVTSLERIVFEEGRETITGYGFFDITTNVEIIIPSSVKEFTSYPFFTRGPVTFVFLGDCPKIVEKTDFYSEATIYYDPNTKGWDSCLWKDSYNVIPIA